MPFDGSGGFTIINTFVPGTTILSSAVNQNYTDIATTGLSNCLTKDGQQTWASNQKCGGFGLTNMVAATASGQAVEYGQWQTGLIPVGMMVDFAGTSAPALWQLCAGQSLLTASFPALFAVIGYTYGGAGLNFTLPDCRGRSTYGKDNMGGSAAGRITATLNYDGTVLGNSGGNQAHTMTSGELVAHNHTGSVSITDPGHAHNLAVGNSAGTGAVQLCTNNAGTPSGIVQSATTGITASTTINNTGSGNPFTVLSPGIITNKIIYAAA